MRATQTVSNEVMVRNTFMLYYVSIVRLHCLRAVPSTAWWNHGSVVYTFQRAPILLPAAAVCRLSSKPTARTMRARRPRR